MVILSCEKALQVGVWLVGRGLPGKGREDKRVRKGGEVRFLNAGSRLQDAALRGCTRKNLRPI